MDARYSQFNYPIEKAIEKGKGEGITDSCVYDVVWSHDQLGINYVWLWPVYGKLLWVDFEEPIGSNNWRTYNRYWWGRHGSVVDHHPDNLVEEHVKFFVNPKTKSINLRFWFEHPNGNVYSMAPTRHFYELERDYFYYHQLCSNLLPASPSPNSPGPNYLYNN